MKTPSRLTRITVFHAIFAGFGDVEANTLNYMAVPIRNFFADSLKINYGIDGNSQEFELIYSFIASSFFMGVLMGNMVLAHCMDRFGRKGASTYIRSSLGMISAGMMILSYYLNRIELFAIAQFLAGVISAFKTVLFIYLAECAPDESRGWSSTLFGSGGTLMLLLISPFCFPELLSNDKNWWILPAICFMLAMIHLFGGAFLPESPKHLFIGQSQESEARTSARFYHGSEVNMKKILEQYKNERKIMHSENVTLPDLFKCHRLRWSFGIVMISALICGVSMLSLKSQYLEPILMRFGLDQSGAMLSTLLMNAVNSPLCLLSPIWIERFGRRPMFLSLTILSSLELAFVAAAQILLDINGGQPAGWFVAFLAIVGCTAGQASVNIGLLNMTPILVGELCPYAARSLLTQVTMSIQTSVMFFLVIAYPSAIVSLGAPFLLLMLATSLIMLVLLFKYLPETKGRPVDEIFRRLTMGRTSDSDALLEAQFLQQQEDSSSSSSSDYGSFDGIESNAVV